MSEHRHIYVISYCSIRLEKRSFLFCGGRGEGEMMKVLGVENTPTLPLLLVGI